MKKICWCCKPPPDKKAYSAAIGMILVYHYGKQKFYSPEKVKEAHFCSRWKENQDFSCWAMSVFSSHVEFDQYHKIIGKNCDYLQMRTQMLKSMAENQSPVLDLLDLSDIDVDSSWLDFGDIFGDILVGIGAFIAGILD